jgi:hypothetical protein
MRVPILVDVGGRKMIDLWDDTALENFLGGTKRPNHVVQQNQRLGVLRHVLDVVGSAEERQSPCPLKVTNPAVEAGPGGGVQAGGRLVEDEKTRIADQCPRNQDPLLLASGEVLEPALLEVAHPHRLQRFLSMNTVLLARSLQ